MTAGPRGPANKHLKNSTFRLSPWRGSLRLRATYGRDPDGNVVELLQAPADSALAVVGGN